MDDAAVNKDNAEAGMVEPAPDAPVSESRPDALAGGTVFSLAMQRDEGIQRAFAELRAGGVVVLPTDTVYGIAANAFDKAATAKIFAIKKRPRSLPLPVLVSRPRQAWALCSDIPPYASELAAAFWPGALTLILRSVEGLDWDLGDEDGTIAVRMPAHSDLIALLEKVGPVACTSANLSGEPTPDRVAEIKSKLGDTVGIYLDGGPAKADRGSTIVDCTGSEPRIIREGPISSLQVRAAANRA
jgi:L-threonylcarbamoyladenylate synthase